MLKGLARRSLRRLGWQLERAPAGAYPYVRGHKIGPHEFRFWIASDIGAKWYDTEKWATDPEPRNLLALVRDGDHVLELGCHHGFLTVLLGLAVGEAGRVTAVEADPENAMIAGSQLALNRLADRCEIVQAVAAARPGMERFSKGGSVAKDADPEARSVEAVSGDDLLRSRGRAALLKVDVEGFEAAALAGCAELLATRPAIALELHYRLLRRYGSSVAEVLRLIGAEGYRGTVVTRRGEEPFSAALIESQSGIETKANLFLEPLG